MVRRRCEDPFRQPGTSAALRFISSRWADSRHLQWPGRIGHKDRSGRSLRCHCRASGSSARPRKWASATSASYQSLAPWRWCATAHGRKNTMGWLDRMLGRRPRLVVAIALEKQGAQINLGDAYKDRTNRDPVTAATCISTFGAPANRASVRLARLFGAAGRTEMTRGGGSPHARRAPPLAATRI